MKDYKGIKILLAICPSSHRSEDLLSYNWRSSAIWDWATWDFWQVGFCCPNFQHTGLLITFAVLHFLYVLLPSHESWVGLLLCFAFALWGPTQGCFSQVKSEKWHDICQGTLSFPRFCLTAAKIWCDGWTSVTAQFYLASKGKIHLQGVRVGRPKRQLEKRGPQLNFGSSFYILFLLPLGLPCVNWASQESRLFHLRFSLQSSDLPLFYFHGLFPSLSFSHHHSGLLFPILTT